MIRLFQKKFAQFEIVRDLLSFANIDEVDLDDSKKDLKTSTKTTQQLFNEMNEPCV